MQVTAPPALLGARRHTKSNQLLFLKIVYILSAPIRRLRSKLKLKLEIKKSKQSNRTLTSEFEVSVKKNSQFADTEVIPRKATELHCFLMYFGELQDLRFYFQLCKIFRGDFACASTIFLSVKYNVPEYKNQWELK